MPVNFLKLRTGARLTSRKCKNDAISAYSKLVSALDARVHRCRRVSGLQMSRRMTFLIIRACNEFSIYVSLLRSRRRCLTSEPRSFLFFVNCSWSNLILCGKKCSLVVGIYTYAMHCNCSFCDILSARRVSAVVQFTMCMGKNMCLKRGRRRNGLSIFIHSCNVITPR